MLVGDDCPVRRNRRIDGAEALRDTLKDSDALTCPRLGTAAEFRQQHAIDGLDHIEEAGADHPLIEPCKGKRGNAFGGLSSCIHVRFTKMT